MPTAADITVKAYNDTTDVVFGKLAASGGDGSPALFAVVGSGSTMQTRDRFEIVTKWNGTKTHRRVTAKGTFPYLSPLGEPKYHVFEFTTAIPADESDSDIQQAVAQFVNLLDSSLIRASIIEAYAPT